MLTEFAIRPAQTSDVDAYVNLLDEVGEWLRVRGLSPLPQGVYFQFKAFYASSVSHGEVHLALIRSELVGTLRLTKNDGNVWPDEDREAICLENLVVRRSWSHHGIGRQLLTWAEEQTAQAGKTALHLDCFANNLRLREYYESAGYTPRGQINAKYPFGVLALQRYVKKLDPK